MDDKQLIRIAKIAAIFAACMIVITCVAIPVIRSSKSKGPTIWEHDSYKEDVNNVAGIKYNRTMFVITGTSTPPQAAQPATPDAVQSTNFNSNYSQLSQACNQALYDICSRNFSVSVGNVTLSPLVPMVIANVETGIRCDPSITFSSLYPSKILKPATATDIYNVSCLDVIASKANFEELAAEYWTRDRGPCQMNPTYGVRNDIYTAAMGRSEYELLSNISITEIYEAYTTREGTITSDYWIEKSSTEKGDRFNPKDICLRLSSEYNYALSTAYRTYSIDTELLALVMCTMHHGAGSLWLPEYTDKPIGLWNSGSRAYELACSLTTQAAYDIISEKVINDLTSARSRGSNPNVTLSTNEANDIFNKLKSKQIVKEQSYYMSGGTYNTDYCVYAIKALYSYVQLSLLYNGG